jgi:hypothetical protein
MGVDGGDGRALVMAVDDCGEDHCGCDHRRRKNDSDFDFADHDRSPLHGIVKIELAMD